MKANKANGVVAVALIGGIAAGCAARPQPVFIEAGSPTEMAEGSSALPDACIGMDTSRGMHLTGHSLYHVVVSLRAVDKPAGKPLVRAWAPANEGESVSTRVERAALPGFPRCSGESLHTEVLRAADGDILRWTLELGVPASNDTGIKGVVLRGELPVTRLGGHAASNVSIGSMLAVADVVVTRGPMGVLKDAEDAPQPRYPHYGRPLPDERFDRTLDQMRRDANLRNR